MTEFHPTETDRLTHLAAAAPQHEGEALTMVSLQEQLRQLILANKPVPAELKGAFHHDRLATLTEYYEAEREGLICERCGQPKSAGDFGCS